MKVEDMLHEAGKRYVQQIRENLASTGTDASGDTSASVGYSVNSEGTKLVLLVTGKRPYFPTVETGSKKSEKNPSPEMVKSISKWRIIRSIQAPAWAIAKNILKYGSRLWQRGGRKDIYTNVREQAFRDMPSQISKAIREATLEKIKA